MKKLIHLLIFIVSLFPITIQSQNVVIVIIDGARYSETFGDPNRTYIPKMDSLSNYGTYIDEFYNDSITYTSRAIPALWCGTWTEVQDTFYNGSWTQYTLQPTLFEYFRKQAPAPADKCYYVLKYISSLWLPSFHTNYGQNYWPAFYSQGSSDSDVLTNALMVMNTYHPQLTWIYFADVDHEGHSGVWNQYTGAIQIADSAVGEIWKFIQNDNFYKDDTYLFVTNDHGRHDDAHGGFQYHGDGCDGCRHIMYLAMGPTVKQNFVSTVNRITPDLTVTVSHLLNLNPEYATGNYMAEIFGPVGVEHEIDERIPDQSTLVNNYPNPFNSTTIIIYVLSNSNHVSLEIFSVSGQKIATLVDQEMSKGKHEVLFDAVNLASGVYLYKLQTGKYQQIKKMIFIK